jgi:hypothetical protein
MPRRGAYYLKSRPRGENEPVDELLVLKSAKDLCNYVFEVTEKSPKSARFTFTTRLQAGALEILELLFMANGLYIGPGGRPQDAAERRSLQQKALTRAKLLAYVAEMAGGQHALLPKQFEQIARLTTSCQRLIGGWITSDNRRAVGAASGAIPPAAVGSGQGAPRSGQPRLPALDERTDARGT